MTARWRSTAFRIGLGLALLARCGAAAQPELLDFASWHEANVVPLFVRGQAPRDEPLQTDRPDFTEASSTVGAGVVQIETGYTFVYDDDRVSGTLKRAHSGPEFLLRYGWNDWIELRLVWNYVWEKHREAGVDEVTDGAEDLIIGTKLGLSQQDRWFPESALILDLSVPTGARPFSNRHAEFGLNYLYGWDITDDWTLAGSTGYGTSGELNVVALPLGHQEFLDRHNVFHQSVTVGHSLTERLGFYFEYFGLYSHGRAVDTPENYVNGGFTYLINNDTQFDIRAGHGLNDAADDFFGGVGMSFRR